MKVGSLANRYPDISSAGSCNVQFCLQFCIVQWCNVCIYILSVPYRVKIVRVSLSQKARRPKTTVFLRNTFILDIKGLLQFFITTSRGARPAIRIYFSSSRLQRDICFCRQLPLALYLKKKYTLKELQKLDKE